MIGNGRDPVLSSVTNALRPFFGRPGGVDQGPVESVRAIGSNGRRGRAAGGESELRFLTQDVPLPDDGTFVPRGTYVNLLV